MSNFQYANNPATVLSGSVTAGATSISVASAADFPTHGKFTIIVDSEIMLVTGVAGTTWTVERGAEGTSAASHNNNAAVTGILTVLSFLNASQFDVRAYGAKGDGATDDTTAIQNAIDAAEIDGGVVFFPAGTFRTTAALVIDSDNVWLRGVAPGASIIDNQGTGNAITVLNDGVIVKNIKFSDLTVQGNSSSAVGIYLAGVHGAELHDVDIQGHGTWGVWLNRVSSVETNEVTFIACNIHDNYATNATLGDGGAVKIGDSGQQCEHIWFYGCKLESNFGSKRSNAIGISISSNINVVGVFGGTISTFGRGVHIFAGGAGSETTAVTIRGVYFEDNDTHIFASASSGGTAKNIVIGDNSFSAASSEAIQLANVDGVKIDGNDVRNSAGNFLTMNSSPLNVMLGLNSQLSNFTGTFINLTAATPDYWYVNRKIQGKRVAGSALAAGATTDITVTWDVPFPDTNYTVSALALLASLAVPPSIHVHDITTTSCIIRIKNNDSVSRTPTIHATAIHD